MSFLPSFALKSALVVALIAVTGCGAKDGLKELELGRAAYSVRDLKKAEKFFQKSVNYAPTRVDAIVELARVKLYMGELSAAKELIESAKKLAPNNSDVRLLFAQIAWHTRDYTTSTALFLAVANDAMFEPEIRSQGWVGAGIVEMACDNIHRARVNFLQALRVDRRNSSAWYHLGLLYRDAFGYNDAALEYLNVYVRLNVDASPRVQKTQRALIPGLKEMIARSTTEIPGAANRDSAKCAEALTKAEAAWKRGEFKTARLRYQDALNFDALSYPAALGLAKAYQKVDGSKAGQEKALENYKRACVLRPSAVSTFMEAGKMATKLGLNAQAVEIYSRAFAANPASLETIDLLIIALGKTGAKREVITAYKEYREAIAKARKR